jgi:hypothetical protein
MRDLADSVGVPWPQLEEVTTREQYLHAVHTFSVGRVAGERYLPGIGPFLDPSSAHASSGWIEVWAVSGCRCSR